MLRNTAKYIAERFPTAANDPVWHWAQLFQGVSPPGFYMHDVDAYGHYKGHSLFIEAKVRGAKMKPEQYENLVKLAENPKHSVLLVGLERSVDEEFKQSWREVCWTWIGQAKRGDPRAVQQGSVAEFKEEARTWFRQIDATVELEERKKAIARVPEQLTLWP